jgi:hypothetical protein
MVHHVLMGVVIAASFIAGMAGLTTVLTVVMFHRDVRRTQRFIVQSPAVHPHQSQFDSDFHA